MFHKAHCVIVIPGMKKAGFVFSGKYVADTLIVEILQVVGARQECELKAVGSDCKWALPKPT